MEGKELDKVTAFDTLFTTNHIQMCKVLLSYLDPSAQQAMAVYIKLSELSYTLSFFKKHPGVSPLELPREETPDVSRICEEMLPFCSPSERERLSSMKQMMQTFRNMQDMMEMMQMMKELFPEGEGGNTCPGNGSGGDILSGLAGLSGMDLSGMMNSSGMDLTALFQMFQSFQMPSGKDDSPQENTEQNKKGD